MRRPLLAFDIDGTLVPHGGRMSSKMVGALKKLHALNWPMLIATARRRKSALMRLEEAAEIFEDGIFNTGASTWEGSQCVRAHTLEPDLLVAALEVLSQWNILDFYSLALADEGLAFSRHLDAEELLEWGVEQKDILPFSEAVEKDPIRICAWKAGADLEPLAESLGQVVPNMNWQVTDGGSCLFGTAKGIGKGKALADYAVAKGYDSEEVMAFGDDFSDLDMLEWAGKGVAMSSSPPEVKALADEVIKDQSHSGLIEWIELNLLKGRA